MAHKSFVVGIAGGTGSGKTSLTNRLLERFSDRSCVVYHDNYYRAHNELSFADRSRLNYDSPDSFDNDLLVEHLDQLLAGESIESPIYDYKNHNRSTLTVLVEPRPLILVEGILLFHDIRLRQRCNLKLFVDTDADVRILRRMKRDMQERGRSIESVEQQYLATVKPMHELYVEPTKRCADAIVPEGGHNPVALDLIARGLAAALDAMTH